ncbi:MAG TPA: EAL domain-containing protein [Frankiaceae bacterium]|jgi:diguanylate cyclase (GGDEF)-like protein/PAS domain S-box-containing protein|nr:EAL domain-containing protein [Frankiaceae bacterium]
MGRRVESQPFFGLSSLLLDALAQAVVGIDADGKVASWNAAAEAMFGRRGTDVLGTPLAELGLRPAGADERPGIIHELASGAPVRRECEGVRADGTTFPALMIDQASTDETFGFTGFFRIVTDLTEPVEQAREADLREARWRALVLRSADVATIAEPVEHRLTYASPAVRRLFGWTPEDILSRLGRSFVHPEDADRVAEALALVKGDPSRHPTIEFRLLCADGSYRWVEETLSNLIDEPAVNGLVANLRDIHDRRIAEDALRASEARYRLIAETAQEGIWAVDTAGRTIYANQKLAQLLGYSMEDVYAMHEFDVADGESRAEFIRRTRWREARGAECYEMPHTRPDGGAVVLRISASPLYEDGHYIGSLAMVADVTAAREAERELRVRATHDSLTGLANRPFLLEKLQLALDNSSESRGRSLAVLVADIDQFKLVNDTLGHAAGDALLIEVSRRWEAVLRPTDILGRLGGDEFVVLCVDAKEEQARRIAARLQRALSRPIAVAGRTVAINASVGIAFVTAGRLNGAAPDDAPPDAGTLLAYADTAMYAAKADGPGNAKVFSASLISHSRRRLRLINDLRSALESDQLQLYYQPVVDLGTGRLLGVEALCRWTHPERGVVSPAEFIPAAEESGLIETLDSWVLHRACRDAAAMRGEGVLPPQAYVAVNVFAGQIGKAGFESDLCIALAESGLPAHALVLEVTESAVMRDPDQALATLERLGRLGVRVAIDDFGTGYSSLGRLSQFPVATLKIDHGFVRHITDRGDHRAIVTAVIDLGHALGVTSTAEGIETYADLRLLQELGCHAGQGFLWSPALPVPELAALLASLPHGRFALALPVDAGAPVPLQRTSPPGY